MLALNGVPLTALPEGDPLANHIRDAIKAIKRIKSWKLVTHSSKIRPPVPGMPTSVRETNAGILQIATGRYVFDGMPNDITYYKRINKTKDGPVFWPDHVDFTSTLPLDPKKDSDLIFFMVCVSNVCAPYMKIEKFQQVLPNSDYYYEVEDILAEAQEKGGVSRKIAKVSRLIYDDDFGLNNKALRNLAVHNGIPTAIDPKMDMEIVRQQLSGYLLEKNNRGLYNMEIIDKFLGDARDDSLATLRNTIRKAVERNLIIIAETSTGNRAWYDTGTTGEKRKHLFSIPAGDDAEIALSRHLAKNPSNRASFESYVENPGTRNAKKTNVQKHVIENVGTETVKSDGENVSDPGITEKK